MQGCIGQLLPVKAASRLHCSRTRRRQACRYRKHTIFSLYDGSITPHSQLMPKFDLRRGDCIEGMSRLLSQTVDLVVTSPPYNLGIRYRKYSDRKDRQSYLKWCTEWATQIRRVLKPSGSFFLNIGAAPSNPMLPHEIAMTLRGLFVLQNTIHWIKSITIEDRNGDPKSHGHFKPINSKRFLNDCHEYIFHFAKCRQVEIDRLALGVPYRTRATLRAGRTLVGVIYAVAATRGSFPTRQFRAARKNDHTLRRSRFNWLNGASSCMEFHAFAPCSIRFLALEIPPSPPNAAA